MNNRIIRISFTLLYIVFIIFLIEYVSRYLILSDWIIQSTPEISSVRWKLRWKKLNITDSITEYSIDTYDPIVGWKPKASVYNEQLGTMKVTINADGIRGSKRYSKTPSQGVIRIVIVGDSFSFGEGVKDDETYPAYLEKIIPNSEVLNLAVHGYGIDQMTLLLEQIGYMYQPQFVIYAIIGDDIRRAGLSFRDYAKPRFELINNNLTLTNVPVPNHKEMKQILDHELAIYDIISLLFDRVRYRNSEIEDFEPLARAIWSRTISGIRQHNAIPIFLFLPVLGQMIDAQSEYLDEERVMMSFCESTKLLCLTARPYILHALDKGEKINTKGHYEANTNRIIAEGIADDIRKNFFSKTDSTK